ncbi:MULTISPECIES: hypothetical protein [unclassified Streptomyces]|uniref:hypothetical protein n=1 Tax=unclassified Streptomyces TaxID=2593676 RepID=UPI0029ABC3BB|nr:hypothetical protein [Streptomyces sp. DK15]MDX2389541.1 hypothetical protein [Streptomyces sp. DK15]
MQRRTKVRRRDTTEAIIGAITGTLKRPQLLILGRHDAAGRLRTVALRPDQARQVAEHLTAAGPGHPWAGVRFASALGTRDVLDAVLVRPELIAEITADRAIDHGGVHRHPVRFKRLRLDAVVEDIPLFGAGPASAAG